MAKPLGGTETADQSAAAPTCRGKGMRAVPESGWPTGPLPQHQRVESARMAQDAVQPVVTVDQAPASSPTGVGRGW